MRNEGMVMGGSGAVAGMLVGAVLGAGIALLLAPAAGPDARRKLGETVRRWGTDLKDLVRDRLSHEEPEFETGQRTRMEPATPRGY